MFSRFIVGWALATHLKTELPLEALEMAIWRRDDAGIAPSVGSVGDAYDNALAETTIGLYKTELLNRKGPWRTPEQVELATLEWIDWWNHRRLHEAIGHVPPAEKEVLYQNQNAPEKSLEIVG